MKKKHKKYLKQWLFAVIIVLSIKSLVDIKSIFNNGILDFSFDILITGFMFLTCYFIYDVLWGNLAFVENK